VRRDAYGTPARPGPNPDRAGARTDRPSSLRIVDDGPMHPAQKSTAVTVAAMTADQWPSVARIYADGIATGDATFETEVPTWEAFDAAKLPGHRIVAVDTAGRVCGWAAVAPVSPRQVYAGVVEHSLYVDPDAQGVGIGRLLLQAVVDSTERAGIWTLQAGIFPENAASIALHYRAGFREVGIRRRVGRMSHGPMAGRWRDVVLLERRSDVAGR
jgi:L-amino acid N-acyltransferase YncA